MRNLVLIYCVLFGLCAPPGAAELVSTDELDDLVNAFAGNVTGQNVLLDVGVGPVTVTHSASAVTGSFGNGASFSLTPFPRDTSGYISTSIPTPIGNQLNELTLNLSETVAGFGVTIWNS